MYRPEDICAMISHRLLISSYVKFPSRYALTCIFLSDIVTGLCSHILDFKCKQIDSYL